MNLTNRPAVGGDLGIWASKLDANLDQVVVAVTAVENALTPGGVGGVSGVVKLQPDGFGDDDGELRITKGGAGTVLTFTSETGTADVNLYRVGADLLKTDDSLIVGATLFLGTGLTATLGADTSYVLLGYVTGDSAARIGITAGGRITIGSGSTSADTNLYRNGADQLATDDDLLINVAGKGLRVKEGSNAKMGVATLVAGAATVSTTAVTANSRIFLTPQSGGGTPGWVRVSARSAGSNFTITSSSGTDTSVIGWLIVEPA